jgi:hypothetical protein
MGTLTFTTATVVTWASYEDQMDNLEFDDARTAKLATMVEEGKTDAEAVIVSPTITKRFFVDTVAAQEYIDFLITNAPLYGVTIISTEIQENAI